MMEEKMHPNPFAKAKTLEAKKEVWSSLKKKAKPVSRDEANRLLEEAVRLQKAKNG